MKNILLIFSILLFCSNIFAQTVPVDVKENPNRPYFLGNVKCADSLGVEGKTFLYGKLTATGKFQIENSTGTKIISDSAIVSGSPVFGLIQRSSSIVSYNSVSTGTARMVVSDTTGNQQSRILLFKQLASITSQGKFSGNSQALQIDSSLVHILCAGGADTAKLMLQNPSYTGTSEFNGFGLLLDDSRNGYVWNYSNSNILFGNNGNEIMRLGSDSTLTVHGTIDTDTLKFSDGSKQITAYSGSADDTSKVSKAGGDTIRGNLYFTDSNSEFFMTVNPEEGFKKISGNLETNYSDGRILFSNAPYSSELFFNNPTTDNSIHLPDSSGTIALLQNIPEVTDTTNIVYFHDTIPTTGAAIASRHDNSLKLNTTDTINQWYSKTATDNRLDLKANNTTTITAGNGLTGGGDMSANRTLSVNIDSVGMLQHTNIWTKNQTILGNLFFSGANRNIWNTTNNFLSFGTNNLERVRIDTSGRVLIGNPTSLAVDEILSLKKTSSAAGLVALKINNGCISGSCASGLQLGNGTIKFVYSTTQMDFTAGNLPNSAFTFNCNAQSLTFGNSGMILGQASQASQYNYALTIPAPTNGGIAGTGYTLTAGRAISGGTNLNGGNILFKTGVSTGTGTGIFSIFTTPGSVSGTSDNTSIERLTILGNGATGIGTTSPTAKLHLPSVTPTANTAPLKFTTGTLLSTPEAGAVEYVTPSLYITTGDNIRQNIMQAAYGSNYGTSTGTTDTIKFATASIYHGWKTATAGSMKLNSFTDNSTADRITVSTGGDGDYQITFVIDGGLSGGATTFQSTIFKNDVATTITFFEDNSSSDMTQTMSGILTGFVANDFIDLRIICGAANRTFTLNNARILMTRILR